jgi:hypothetical protein
MSGWDLLRCCILIWVWAAGELLCFVWITLLDLQNAQNEIPKTAIPLKQRGVAEEEVI